MREKQTSADARDAISRRGSRPTTTPTVGTTTPTPTATTRRSTTTEPMTMARASTARTASPRSGTATAKRPKAKEATKREALKPESAAPTTMAMAMVMNGGAVVPRSPGVLSEPPLRSGGGGGIGGGVGPPPSAALPLRRTVSSITTDAEEVKRLRAQLQGMKEQVYFLHKMMQGLSGQEKQLLKGKHLPVEHKRLSFAGISPVKKTRGSVDVIVMPDEKIPFADKWKLPTTQEHQPSSFDGPTFPRTPIAPTRPSPKELELQAKLDAMQLENDALKTQLEQQKQASASAEADLHTQIEDWSTKVAVLDAENTHLLSTIEEYEEENLRLHGALTQIANEQEEISAESNNRPGGHGHGDGDHSGDLDDELGIDGLGEEPKDIHERCDAKIHELWQTIKTLKAYVETFRVEIEDLKVQRDNAIQSAERAWEENTKLAGNNNPQQKIKYLEVVKKENAELIQKVRELQSKLTKKQLKADDSGDVHKSNRRSSAAGSEPLEEYPSIVDSDDVPSDDGSEGERTKLLKKMWVRNKKLEEEIDRLRKEKQELAMRQPRSRSITSRQSSTKSAGSFGWKS